MERKLFLSGRKDGQDMLSSKVYLKRRRRRRRNFHFTQFDFEEEKSGKMEPEKPKVSENFDRGIQIEREISTLVAQDEFQQRDQNLKSDKSI